MATNDKRTQLYNRKFTSISALDTYFYGTLNTGISDALRSTCPTGITGGGILSSSVAGTLNLSALSAIDYNGHILDVSALSNIPFENTAGIIYYVGLKWIETEVGIITPTMDDAVEINDNTGNPEYAFWQEQVGEIGNPSSVHNILDYILKIVIDSVTTVGRSWAGRTARVWLSSLLSIDIGWHEDLIIQWNGVNNYVMTTGDFHQTAVRGTISTEPAAYRVWVPGPTITTTNITADTDYVMVGTVLGTGGIIPAINITQDSSYFVSVFGTVSNNLLQLARDIYGNRYVFNGDGIRSSRLAITFSDLNTSPNVSGSDLFFAENSIATIIRAFDNGVVGDEITVVALNGNTTIRHESHWIALKNAVNFVMSPWDSITLKCIGSDLWHEVYRSEIA